MEKPVSSVANASQVLHSDYNWAHFKMNMFDSWSGTVRMQLYCLNKISLLFEVFVKGFLILQPRHTQGISSIFPGLLLTALVFTMGCTGLGSALLQHLVSYCFLLYSSMFAQCSPNDSAEENPMFSSLKSFTVLYRKPLISVYLSLTWEKDSFHWSMHAVAMDTTSRAR